MASIPDASEPSDDAFLGGRLRLLQPRRGHRAGHDAVLLAAACPAGPEETVADLGAGVGTAGLCVAARVPGARALLVERDPELCALARANAERNGLSGRAAALLLDVTAPGAVRAAAGLGPGCADHVVMNPPFHERGRARVAGEKAAAHVAEPDALAAWLRTATATVRPGGTVTVLHRADALAALLQAIGGRLGGIAILPVHAAPGRPALRLLLNGRRGSRAPLALLPSFVLADPPGRNTPAAEAVLRGNAALPFDAAALCRLVAVPRV